MDKLEIYEFQAKLIEDTLRMVANAFHSKERQTSLDRDVMQSLQMIRNVLSKEIDKEARRFPALNH